MFSRVLHHLIFAFCFFIPLAWWTRLNANYHSTKLCLVYFVAGLAFLAFPRSFSLPKLIRPLWVSLVLIIFYQLIFYTYKFDYFSFLFLFKFLSFLALALYFYTAELTLEKIYSYTGYIIFIVGTLIMGFSIYEFYQFRILQNTTNISLFISTFGNVNMFAEFLILSLPLLFHWSRYQDKLPQWVKLTLFALWVFFILYSRSRSAWLGLAFWTALQLRYNITKKEQVYLGVAIAAFLVSLYAPAEADKLDSIKQNNVTARSALYEATFEMIKDHPWGIAPGTYIGEIEPYRMLTSVKPSEYNYYDQPHTEVLKWAAQFGWLFSAITLVFATSVFYFIAKWFWAGKNAFLVESFVVLVPQILFQFPYENPASILYLSFVTAMFFMQFEKYNPIKLPIWYKLITVGLCVLCIFNSYAFVNSVYEESTIPRNEEIISACEMYPLNVKACHAKLIYLYDRGRYEEFASHFKTEFMREPLFVDFLRLLPIYYSSGRDNKKACEALYVYRVLFPQQVSFDVKYYEACKTVPDYFYFDEPKKFKARYLTWLNELK